MAIASSAPLGPGSLTWRHFGESRGVLLAIRAGVLQAMHPAISAALLEHSNYFDNPLDRLFRSAGPILGVVYDTDPEATGAWVRDQHPPIRGRDEQGRSYHALDPDTYYWAHATFFESIIATQELFGRALTSAQKEQLYAESVTWYARYGLTMRPVPPDYDAFQRYWQRMFVEVLEATPAALSGVAAPVALPAPTPQLAGRGWDAIAPLVGHSSAWLARVTLPTQAREILGLGVRMGVADRVALQLLRGAVRGAWPLLPRRLALLPRAQV